MTLEEENINLQWILGYTKDNLNRHKIKLKTLIEEKNKIGENT